MEKCATKFIIGVGFERIGDALGVGITRLILLLFVQRQSIAGYGTRASENHLAGEYPHGSMPFPGKGRCEESRSFQIQGANPGLAYEIQPVD